MAHSSPATVSLGKCSSVSALLSCPRALFFLLSSPPFSTSLFSHLDVMEHFIAVAERDDRFCSVNGVNCVGRKGALAGEASASSEKWIQIPPLYGKLRAGWVLC